MKTTIQLTGAREFRRALNQMEKGLGGKGMKAIHDEVGGLVARTAKGTAPRRSGRLAESIRSKPTTRQANVSAGKGSIPYAGVIHFGWPGHNIRANKFLYRGIALSPFDAILDVYSEGVESMAKQAGLDYRRGR